MIALLAVPILIQVFFNSGLAYLLNRRLGVAHCVAGPSALIGASNFFELAVAAAISLFGFESGAALATVVGVLIEVPVMLLVVRVVNSSQGLVRNPGSLKAPDGNVLTQAPRSASVELRRRRHGLQGQLATGDSMMPALRAPGPVDQRAWVRFCSIAQRSAAA